MAHSLSRLIHWALAAALAGNAFIIGDESALHISVGYFCAAILVSWIAFGAIGIVPAVHHKPGALLPDLMRQGKRIVTGRGPLLVGASPINRFITLNLFASIAAICLSGWLMTLAPIMLTGLLEELHEAAVFWTGLSLLVHVGGKVWTRHARIQATQATASRVTA